MAEDLATSERPRSLEAPLVEHPGGARKRGAHRRRFVLAYLALGVMLGVAAAAFVVLAERPAEKEAAAWSPWQPAREAGEYPSQIARYVGGKYKLANGNPIVNVIQQPPQVQNVAIRWVAIQGSSGVVSTNGSLMYVLCGRGRRCSIKEGKPTADRLRALKREGLELALYTFKYVDGVDSVIELLPPTASGKSTGALYFRKRDLEGELDRPLGNTLARPGAVKHARVEPSEVLTVERLTKPYLFNYEFQQAQDGSAVMVLAHPAG